MNTKQMEWLINSTPEKRYKSFLENVADGNDVWYLYGTNDGFFRFNDDDGIYIPVWAFGELSDYFKGVMGFNCDLKPHHADINEFLIKCEALDDYINFMVFPTEKNSFSVSPKQLCSDLRDALDRRFMKEAILLSEAAVTHGNEPFGAVLVKDNRVVFRNENQIYTKNDPTFHAEMGLIKRFIKETGKTDLSSYTLYSSCEPCFMCSGAMVWAKLGRLVYAASNTDLEEILGNKGCECSEMVFENSFYKPQVTKGVLRDESVAVLEEYFSKHKKG